MKKRPNTSHTNPVVDVDGIIVLTFTPLTCVVAVDMKENGIALKGIMARFTHKESYAFRTNKEMKEE